MDEEPTLEELDGLFNELRKTDDHLKAAEQVEWYRSDVLRIRRKVNALLDTVRGRRRWAANQKKSAA